MYCDKTLVVKLSSVPASVLHKRHNDICYHKVIEVKSAVTLRVGWVPGEYNIVDLFTKTKMTINMKNRMVESIFYNKAAVIKYKYKNLAEGVK